MREPISSAKDSILRIVPMAPRARFDNSICYQPINARAARSCLPVINARKLAPGSSQLQETKHCNQVVDYYNQFMR